MSEWPMVKLGEVCSISIGKTPARKELRYWGEGLPWLSIKDMNQGSLILKTTESISQIALDELKITPYSVGTVLFSFKLSIGKVGITAVPLFTNEAIAAIEPKEQESLNKYYLMEVLREVGKTVEGNAAVMGVTLNKKSLAELKIPLPPLGEQKRIAEILGKTTGAISSVQKQIEQAKKLRSSIVGMASKMAVELRAISEYFDINPRQPRNIPDNAPTSFVPMANLDETFGISPIASRFSEHKKGYTYFENGDIVLAKITPCFENGKSAIAKLSTQIGHGSTEFHVLRHKNHMHQDACLSPLLTAAILKQPSFLKPAENFMRGSAGQKRIPVSYIASLKVPVLKSVDLEKIDQSLEIVEALLNLYHRKLSLLQELQKSLATRAFAGLL
jgi:hypothetical protein